MTSEIDKLKHFHVENYSDTNFTDDLNDGTCQNRRKSNVFKEPDGSIHYNEAFTRRPISRYNFDTKEWTDNKNPICWHGGLWLLMLIILIYCYLMLIIIFNGKNVLV